MQGNKQQDIWLLSNEIITNRSRKYRDGYLTDITLNKFDDLMLSKMYATYKENEYEVQRVYRRLKKQSYQLEKISQKRIFDLVLKMIFMSV